MAEKQAPSLAEELALFRYGIIAPVLHDTERKQTHYFKQMAKKVYDVPGLGRRRYSWKTFKGWLSNYRHHGFVMLKPQIRSDKGTSRRVDDFLAGVIQQKFAEFPHLKITPLYRLLVEDGCIHQGSPSEAAVRKFIQQQQLQPPATEPTPRKKFEKPHINDLWLSDFMHGPQFKIDGVKRKLFLGGIIDDHSRLIVGAQWTLRENTEALELVFQTALATYGCPKLFYCDNGAVYATSHLQLICARIGVALVHSKPYDSPARGKIERFWRTVREGFLPLVPHDADYSLANFNHHFAEWLAHHYHRRLHHGINQTPLDRFLEDQKNVTPRRFAATELERYFFQTYHRKVKNDATVSVNAILFEVPAKYIGTDVELRHPTGQPTDLWLYENEQPVLKLQPVNLVENSKTAGRGIRFNNNLPTKD
jgi:transposase InsO family protein